MSRNNNSIVVGPEQVIAAITDYKPHDFGDLLKPVSSSYEKIQINHAGIEIIALNCEHTYQVKHKEIENIAYLVKMDGFNILHVGDTDWELAVSCFNKLGLTNNKLDVAILPFWMMYSEEDKSRIQSNINARYMIATHISPENANEFEQRFQSFFPQDLSLTNKNESHVFYK